MEKIREFVENDEKITKLVKLLFESLDEDRSGTIQLDELNSVLNDGKDRNFDDDIVKALKILDTDGSGTVDFYELKEFVKQLLSRYLKKE